MKLVDNYVTYVRNAINLIVRDTGYPVIGKSLSNAGIASRKQLKALVKKGHLKEMKVRGEDGVILNAYYTESEPPKKFIVKKEEILPSEE